MQLEFTWIHALSYCWGSFSVCVGLPKQDKKNKLGALTLETTTRSYSINIFNLSTPPQIFEKEPLAKE